MCMYRPLESSVLLSWLQVLWAWIEVVTPSAPFPGFSRFLAFFFLPQLALLLWCQWLFDWLPLNSTANQHTVKGCLAAVWLEKEKKTHLCRRACFCCHPTRFVCNGAPLALLASSCCGSELDCLLVVYIPLPACSIFKLTGNVWNCGYLFW